jgi:hypothetical protein
MPRLRSSGLSLNGAPGAIPTRDLSLRRRALYATELREHNVGIVQRQLLVVSC